MDRLLRLLLLVAVAVPPAAAQQDPLAPLVEEGLRHNLSLLQERLADRQAALRARQVRAGLLPTVDLDARYTEYSGALDLGSLVNPAHASLNQLLGEDRFPTDLSFPFPLKQDARVRLVQPVVNPELWAAASIATAEREVAQDRLGVAARQLAAGIQGAWLQLASAEQVVTLYDQTAALLDENLRVNQRLLAAGTATPDVVLRAQAERSELEQQRQEAGRVRNAARRALNQLLGRPLEAPLDVPAGTTVSLPDSLPLDVALSSARQRREELGQVRAGARAAAAQVRLATGSFLPSLSLVADYGFTDNELRFSATNDIASASVVVQWNLFSGGRDRARRQEAQLAVDRARAQLAEAERLVELDVRQAHDALDVARTGRLAALDRLAAAERTFALVKRRYEEGAAPYIEFLDARTTFTSAGLNAIVSRFAVAARWIDLERAAALRSLSLDTLAQERVP